jgi:hypothetical protein
VREGHIEVVRVLLEAGVNVNETLKPRRIDPRRQPARVTSQSGAAPVRCWFQQKGYDRVYEISTKSSQSLPRNLKNRKAPVERSHSLQGRWHVMPTSRDRDARGQHLARLAGFRPVPVTYWRVGAIPTRTVLLYRIVDRDSAELIGDKNAAHRLDSAGPG